MPWISLTVADAGKRQLSPRREPAARRLRRPLGYDGGGAGVVVNRSRIALLLRLAARTLFATAVIARSAEEANAGVGVLQIIGDDVVARHRRAHESVLALGDDRVPALLSRIVDADGDDPSLRRVAVGAHVEIRATVAHELVLGVELVDQPDDRIVDLRLARVVEIDEVEAVAIVGALRHGDDEILAIIGHASEQKPVGLIGPVVDQLVARLRPANAMVVDLMIAVDVGHLVAGRRLVVPRVEEALVVVRPGNPRELDPLHGVGEIPRVVDVADVQLLPVGPAGREAVGEIVPVIRRSLPRQRHRSVRRENVGIEQHARRSASAILHVQHALILEARVLEIEVAAALLERGGKTRIIPDLRQPVLDRRPLGNRRQEGVGELVLGFDPRLRLGRVGILEPPVGIGDADAVIDIDLGAARRRRIADWRILRLGTHGAGDDGEQREGAEEGVTTHVEWNLRV